MFDYDVVAFSSIFFTVAEIKIKSAVSGLLHTLAGGT